MYLALIVLFFTLAVLALIGWGVTYVVGRFTRRLRPEPVPTQGPSLVVRRVDAVEVPEQDGKTVNGTAQAGVVIETYFEKGKWKNKVRGNTRASNVHATREAAVDVAIEMAAKRKAKHVILEQDGSARA